MVSIDSCLRLSRSSSVTSRGGCSSWPHQSTMLITIGACASPSVGTDAAAVGDAMDLSPERGLYVYLRSAQVSANVKLVDGLVLG